MGINHLRLSTEMIAALYPEYLVVGNSPEKGRSETKTKPSVPSGEAAYAFLGKNQRAVCFCVSYPDDEFMPAEPLVFLQKILAACKCTLNDISLVNVKNGGVSLEALKSQFNPRIVFLWGSVPGNMGISRGWPDMEISTWEDISVIPVMWADQMTGDNPQALELKRRLWISLKKIFSL